MLVTLPFVLLLLDYWPLRRFDGSTFQRFNAAPIVPLALEKLPFLLLSVASSAMTYRAQQAGEAVALASRLGIVPRAANAVISYIRYLGKTFWPVDLAVPYPHPEHWPLLEVVLAASLVVAVSAGAIWFARRAPFLTVGWFWFLGMLVPVIGLVQVGSQSMADRYTYLPLIGVFLIFSWGAEWLWTRWRWPKNVAAVAAAVVCLACANRTATQVGYWKNSGTLFGHAVSVTKNNYMAYNNLGAWLLERGQFAEALSVFATALQIIIGDTVVLPAEPPPLTLVTNAAHVNVLDNLGATLARMGREKEAMPFFRRALELKPNDLDSINNLGLALLAQNQVADSLACFQQALRLRPDFHKARLNLGNGLAAVGRMDEAIEQYRSVLRQCPDCGDVHTPLGIALARRGLTDEAIAQFQEAARSFPDSPQCHNNLANALAERGRNDEALGEYREALRLQPDSAQSHLNLGILLEQLGRRDEAVMHLKDALRLDRGNAPLKQHLRALGVAVPD